jgi:LuxR family maltose regulon positive regulatory protein
VLDRICVPVCEALTGRTDGAELISEIGRANLSVIPLDDERRWFRYHDLFGSPLRHELARSSPKRPAVLHRRGGAVVRGARRRHRAIGHAIASGDDALSSRLIAAYWLRTFNVGQLETVRTWLDALPAKLVATDASLSAARLLLALDTGRLEEVSAAMDPAEASGPPDTRLMFLRALRIYKTGDVDGAVARLPEFSPSADDAFTVTVHRLVLGMTDAAGRRRPRLGTAR